jgi:hypothetical protein
MARLVDCARSLFPGAIKSPHRLEPDTEFLSFKITSGSETCCVDVVRTNELGELFLMKFAFHTTPTVEDLADLATYKRIAERAGHTVTRVAVFHLQPGSGDWRTISSPERLLPNNLFRVAHVTEAVGEMTGAPVIHVAGKKPRFA